MCLSHRQCSLETTSRVGPQLLERTTGFPGTRDGVKVVALKNLDPLREYKCSLASQTFQKGLLAGLTCGHCEAVDLWLKAHQLLRIIGAEKGTESTFGSTAESMIGSPGLRSHPGLMRDLNRQILLFVSSYTDSFHSFLFLSVGPPSRSHLTYVQPWLGLPWVFHPGTRHTGLRLATHWRMQRGKLGGAF